MFEIFVCLITNSLITGMRILNFIKNPDHISKIFFKKKLKKTGVDSWKFV
jgi:hypothetical protein